MESFWNSNTPSLYWQCESSNFQETRLFSSLYSIVSRTLWTWWFPPNWNSLSYILNIFYPASLKWLLLLLIIQCDLINVDTKYSCLASSMLSFCNLKMKTNSHQLGKSRILLYQSLWARTSYFKQMTIWIPLCIFLGSLKHWPSSCFWF